MKSKHLGELVEEVYGVLHKTVTPHDTPLWPDYPVTYYINTEDIHTQAELIPVDEALTAFFAEVPQQKSAVATVLRKAWDNFHAMVSDITDASLSENIPIDERLPWHKETIARAYKLKELDNGADIWEFVWPNEVMIKIHDNGQVIIELYCGALWDEEHGVELVFEDGYKLVDEEH